MNSHWRPASNNLMKLDWPSRMIPDHPGPSRTILDDSVQSRMIPDNPGLPGLSWMIQGNPGWFLLSLKEKKTLKKKIQNVSFTKSKVSVLPNPKCQFYQIHNVGFTIPKCQFYKIQNVSFTKSKMSVLPNPKCRFYQIQSVSFTKSKMSFLPNP